MADDTGYEMAFTLFNEGAEMPELLQAYKEVKMFVWAMLAVRLAGKAKGIETGRSGLIHSFLHSWRTYLPGNGDEARSFCLFSALQPDGNSFRWLGRIRGKIALFRTRLGLAAQRGSRLARAPR